MLEITVNEPEMWDEANQRFIPGRDHVLRLEHSLVSLSKWESKWHKPFISAEEKTAEETLDYVKCMTITQNVDPRIYTLLTQKHVDAINEYIDDSMTATWFNEEQSKGKKKSSEQITAEVVYYWMVAFNIPFECQKWHLNRLLTLIRVCNIKNQPPKKMGKKDILRQNAALNAARRKKMGSRG